MAILMMWPLLVAALVWLYDWRVRRQVQKRNEGITHAYVEVVEQSIQFQRELFEAGR